MFTKNEARELIETLTYVGETLGPQIEILAKEIIKSLKVPAY